MFRPKPLIYAALFATLLVTGAWMQHLLSQGGFYRDLAFHGGESCTRLDGYVGAEDIVVDHARRVAYVSSDDRRAAFAGEAVEGQILAVSLDNLSAAPKALPTGLTGFHPHGIDLWIGPQGARRLMVINHSADGAEQVEIFDLTQNAFGLAHLRTVQDGSIHSPNDLAAVGPEHFYFTNDNGSVSTLGRLQELLQLASRANLVYYDGVQGHVQHADFLLANGIGAHPDGKTVVMTEFYGQTLWLFDRDPATGALTGRDVIHLPTHMDNINFDQDGGIWIGAQPNAIAMLGHAMDAESHSPSQVLRITLNESGPGGKVDEVLLNDGALLSASSVAAPYTAADGASRMLVGGIFDSHILDCAVTQ